MPSTVTTFCGVPQEVLDLVHLRVSQFNGCSFCVDGGLKSLRKLGVSDERIGLVAAWRETPYYSDEERAVALTRVATAHNGLVVDQR